MTDIDLVQRAVAASGLSLRQFAEDVLGRDERTVRRWTHGTVVPARARRWLTDFLTMHPDERGRLVASLTGGVRRRAGRPPTTGG